MNDGIMGSFSKMMGEKKVFIDPYVQVIFAGQQVYNITFTITQILLTI